MMDIEYNLHGSMLQMIEVSQWLDKEMPNPPLPETQRWTIGYSKDGRTGIRFSNDADATLFSLKWK